MYNVAILGTGRFALSILYLLSKNIRKVTIYGRDPEQLYELSENQTNIKYCQKKYNLKINTKIIENFDRENNYDIIFFCLPVQCIEPIFISDNMVFTCKGIPENGFLYRKFNYIKYGLLMGPSYAYEILSDKYTVFQMASKNNNLNKKVSKVLSNEICEIKITTHTETVEILSTFKNIMSIGCGALQSLDMGKNTISAFILKMLDSIRKDIYNLDLNTCIGPAGLGDIFLTCSSIQSRNYRYGSNLITKKISEPMLVEGLKSINYIIKYVHKKTFIYRYCDWILNLKNNNHQKSIKNFINLMNY